VRNKYNEKSPVEYPEGESMIVYSITPSKLEFTSEGENKGNS